MSTNSGLASSSIIRGRKKRKHEGATLDIQKVRDNEQEKLASGGDLCSPCETAPEHALSTAGVDTSN